LKELGPALGKFSGKPELQYRNIFYQLSPHLNTQSTAQFTHLWELLETTEGKNTAMSRAAKLTLLGASTFALSTIIFVHFQQRSEKAVCPTEL